MRFGSGVVAGVLAVFIVACSSANNPGVPDGTPAVDAASSVDPFAPMPDTSEGLTNVSNDLDALLEHGQLAGACARYWGGQTDRRSMLLCGKSMFFDEPFGTIGIPEPIVAYYATNFPDSSGSAFPRSGPSRTRARIATGRSASRRPYPPGARRASHSPALAAT